MKFFIDTADIEEIKKAHAMGMVDGVTTNPSLVAKTGRPFADVLKDILAVVDGPVNAEVVSLDTAGMVKEGKDYAKLHDNIVVKVPMTMDGLAAVKQLTAEGIPTNVTLIFSPNQALLAAKAGASYVSPFVGRLDDISEDGMAMVAQILEIFGNYDFETQTLVASVRNPIHVVQAARMGADVATLPFAVMQQLAQHPLTDAGLKKFLSDWEKVPSGKSAQR
jgi:transaldolase